MGLLDNFRIPSRHDRESIHSDVEGFDDPLVLQAVRDIAKRKNWKPGLADFVSDETFSNMLESIINQRIGMATITPEEMASAGMTGNKEDYGYIFEPEQGVWGSATMESAKSRGLPWYKTSREAIDAIYDDALRDDNGKLVGNFTLSDLYKEMNRRLGEATSQALAEDPSIEQALIDSGVMKMQTFRDENGQESKRAVPV